MSERRYLRFMFGKLATVSFNRRLETLVKTAAPLQLTESAGKVQKKVPDWAPWREQASTGARSEASYIGKRLKEDLLYGGPKHQQKQYPGVFSKGSIGKMTRSFAPGAAAGALIAGGMSRYRGEDAKDNARSAAKGGLAGGLATSLVSPMISGSSKSPLYNTMGRNMNRLGAGMALLEGGNALTRKRREGEGFFESVGRRAGNIGTAASVYANPTSSFARGAGKLMMGQLAGAVAGTAASAAGYKRTGDLLSSIPGMGDIGGTIGKGLDVASTGVRKAFGGGKSYSKVKSEALGKPKGLQQPSPRRLAGQQFKRSPNYS